MKFRPSQEVIARLPMGQWIRRFSPATIGRTTHQPEYPMCRFRLSILGFMTLIGFIALGFAALASPSPPLAVQFFSLNLALATLALLGALFARRQRRTFWGGYCAVAW